MRLSHHTYPKKEVEMIAIYSCVCSFVHHIYLFIVPFIAFIYLSISFLFFVHLFVRSFHLFIHVSLVRSFIPFIYVCLFRNYVIISFNREYACHASLPHAHVYSVTLIGTRQLL